MIYNIECLRKLLILGEIERNDLLGLVRDLYISGSETEEKFQETYKVFTLFRNWLNHRELSRGGALSVVEGFYIMLVEYDNNNSALSFFWNNIFNGFRVELRDLFLRNKLPVIVVDSPKAFLGLVKRLVVTLDGIPLDFSKLPENKLSKIAQIVDSSFLSRRVEFDNLPQKAIISFNIELNQYCFTLYTRKGLNWSVPII